MAYTQKHKYGYRDSLDKGDPEKVIYGQSFDDEFEAIEEAFNGVPGSGGDPIAPEIPGFEDVVFQTRTEDQQVVSKFTFAVDGQAPLTVENTGIWNDVNYVRYDTVDATWKVFPGLAVDGDFTVTGETSLTGNLNVDGDIDATGNLNIEENLTIGGQIEGDLVVNGNITIEGGGEIIDPDGKPVGTGAGMVISETEPADKAEGMQWLNPTTGLVLFWDDEKWLQMPGAADGTDGKGWTSGAYDPDTGVITFTSDDELGFVTEDLRGADGADGAGIDADGNIAANKIVLGGWTIEESGGELVFSSGGGAVAKITAAGQIVGADDVTAFGI